MGFQIKTIRAAIRAIKSALPSVFSGTTAAETTLVLDDIQRTLGYLGVEHWVSMEEFMNAAVRVGLSREVGAIIYEVVSFLI